MKAENFEYTETGSQAEVKFQFSVDEFIILALSIFLRCFIEWYSILRKSISALSFLHCLFFYLPWVTQGVPDWFDEFCLKNQVTYLFYISSKYFYHQNVTENASMKIFNWSKIIITNPFWIYQISNFEIVGFTRFWWMDQKLSSWLKPTDSLRSLMSELNGVD